MNNNLENVSFVSVNKSNMFMLLELMNMMGLAHGHEKQNNNHLLKHINNDILSHENKIKLFVLEDKEKGRVAGYTLLTPLVDEKGRKGMMLEDLFVHPDYRSFGYGTHIKNFVADWAVKNGCSFVRSLNSEHNENMIRLNQDVFNATRSGYNAYVQPEYKVGSRYEAREINNADLLKSYCGVGRQFPEEFARLKKMVTLADKNNHMLVGAFDKGGRLVSASIGSTTYLSNPCGYGYVSEKPLFFTLSGMEKVESMKATIDFTASETKKRGWDIDVVYQVDKKDTSLNYYMSSIMNKDMMSKDANWVMFTLEGEPLKRASNIYRGAKVGMKVSEKKFSLTNNNVQSILQMKKNEYRSS